MTFKIIYCQQHLIRLSWCSDLFFRVLLRSYPIAFLSVISHFVGFRPVLKIFVLLTWSLNRALFSKNMLFPLTFFFCNARLSRTLIQNCKNFSNPFQLILKFSKHGVDILEIYHYKTFYSPDGE